MRKKIEFLDELFKHLQCRSEILDFLKQEKLINDDFKQTLLHEHHGTHSTKIATLFNDLVRDEQLQLVDYEWTILPKQFMKLTLVSTNAKKEFVYSV